jgi:hypothetical protein
MFLPVFFGDERRIDQVAHIPVCLLHHAEVKHLQRFVLVMQRGDADTGRIEILTDV